MMYFQDYEAGPIGYDSSGQWAWPLTYCGHNPILRCWWETITPYVKNEDVFNCPSAKLRKTGSSGNAGRPYPKNGLALTQSYPTSISPGPESVNVCPQPARVALFADSSIGYGWSAATAFSDYDRAKIKFPYGDCTSGTACLDPNDSMTRHSGGSNVGFLDGHVKWLRWQQLAIYGETNRAPLTPPEAKWLWWPRYGVNPDVP
jgi:prepilin-type processing-associated H-X9-DG protein